MIVTCIYTDKSLVRFDQLLAEHNGERLHVFLIECDNPLEAFNKFLIFYFIHYLQVLVKHLLEGRAQEALSDFVIFKKFVNSSS